MTRPRRPLRGAQALLLAALAAAGCRHPAPPAPPLPPAAVESTPRAEPHRPPGASYTAAMCEAIGENWFNLLDPRVALAAGDRVVLRCALTEDGRVSDLTVPEEGARLGATLLCRKAVLDAAPFPPWPPALRRQYGHARYFRLAFDFDQANEPYLSCWELWPEAVAAVPTGPPLVVYLPQQKRLAAPDSRLWAASVPPHPAKTPDTTLGVGSHWYPSGPWSGWDWPGWPVWPYYGWPYDGYWDPVHHHHHHPPGPPPPHGGHSGPPPSPQPNR